MLRAVELARNGLGTTSPNPAVGAVVLDARGSVAGEGWHEHAGGPHAERVALDAAGSRARGGTLVVTLEPCAHTGRTPPCVDAVLAAGVARVVYAVADPVAGHGGGTDWLRASGVATEADVERDAAERGNEAWLTSARLGRPFVTLKLAVTLDGRVAADDGSSRWITSAEARADAHVLRGQCDAVAVGISTVLIDDPHLTVRNNSELATRQPLRVVADSTGRTPAGARVADGTAPTLIATTAAGVGPLAASGPEKADVVELPAAADGHTDVPALLAELRDRDVIHLLVEGGPKLAATFLDLDLVDRIVAYVAPAVMGSGRSAVEGGRGTPGIDALRRFRLDDVTQVGGDARLTMRRP
jgi:diaminohydroxyphosphoribosylaminopyrimidine deaminase/5-amino-6-(5-phosphoribosylamino)uracil reductase